MDISNRVGVIEAFTLSGQQNRIHNVDAGARQVEPDAQSVAGIHLRKPHRNYPSTLAKNYGHPLRAYDLTSFNALTAQDFEAEVSGIGVAGDPLRRSEPSIAGRRFVENLKILFMAMDNPPPC